MDRDEMAKASGNGKYRRVEVKRVLEAPIEKVWSAITNADELSKWWASGAVDPLEGGRFQLGMDDDCGEDGLPLDGVIKVFEPPHVLAFTWHEKYEPAAGLVRIDLVELDENRTQFTLVQTIPKDDVIPASAGWHEITDRLGLYVCKGDALANSENDERYQELKTLYEEALH